MLKRNVEAGLVSGSVGKVTGLNTTTPGNTTVVNTVAVKFDNIDAIINIERDSASFEVLKSVYYTRKQFPLMLAFAITIHKSQGLSLHTAIVDAGATNFGPGMVYVALSRVTSLAGLHLVDFDRSKIACDQLAIKEYNRLRELYTPQLGNLDTADSSSSRKRKKTTKGSEAGTKKKPRKTIKQTPDKSNSKQQETPEYTDSIATFDCCQIQSVDESFQKALCSRLNLNIFPHVQSVMSSSQAAIARQLEELIYTKTGKTAAVHIQHISGDGNCLFRAISNAVSRSQTQHELLRMYITSHMAEPEVAEKLQLLFTGGGGHEQSHTQHVMSMQQLGQWGTERELATSAHLFDCSVVCFSKYSDTQFCLQQFPPHFIDSTECTTTCNHKTIYIINSSGSHYESAVVRTTQTDTNDSEE